MELSEMNLAEVLERLASLEKEVREMTEVEAVEAATEEKKALLERKKELEDIEERKADAEALESHKEDGKIVEAVEERKENDMEINYREAWLKNLMGKEITEEERAAVTGSAAVIPTETLNMIVTRLNENALLGKVDLLQIPGYVRIPVYSNNADATWTTTSTDSADAMTYIDLTPYQLIKTVEIGADMKAMSIPAFESYLAKALANKIESALQKAILVGGGSSSSEPTGILVANTSAAGTFTKAAATKADLLKIMASLPADYQANATWIMPAKVFYSEVMAIADHNSFVNVNDGFSFRLFGKPVVVDDNCKVGGVDEILYGDLKHYHLNMGEGVSIDKNDAIGFRSNSVVFRGVCQADGKLDNAAAFVQYYRAS